jgi:uncharacterized protein YggU (UPF0235/DUF167 family)
MDFAALKIEEKSDEVRFPVHARPRSKRSGIEGVREGALDVALRSVPEKGAANDELVRVLAGLWTCPSGACASCEANPRGKRRSR